ncbi:cobalamin-independent methionine synthase II family protein [Roseiarcaceae bacterium H3SJ34-1]|uniref:cobalamin-independent methionine synthase II family protein n=1 Tax=Terripilifer ovatus TaxID=3032367 RepID=UPI003AB96E74|nr:cobalamin-independent methionine synthase II family protein [Roseiarcaceae bacterium H3SJ34-1]
MSAKVRTTHAGALPRSAALTTLVRARAGGSSVDATALDDMLAADVDDAIRRQVQCGLDSVNDGELSKSNFMHYVTERVRGIQVREYMPGEGPQPLSITARDAVKFPDYFAEGRGGFASGGKEDVRRKIRQHLCVEPLEYIGGAHVQKDIDNLRAALSKHGGPAPFLCSVTPGVLEHWITNEHYKSQEELLYALGDLMRAEYTKITDAGFMLQIDNPDLVDGWQMYPQMDVASYRKYAQVRVDVLNHALRGIPKEKIRMHVCWGSYHGPHEFDLPLQEIGDIFFEVNAAEFSIEAANPRHEHEWQVFETLKLPEGAALAPGVVGHCTNFIEHPELIAQRLVRYGKLVGAENLIASTDCGLGNRTATPTICWAKLDALVEGAARASRILAG